MVIPEGKIGYGDVESHAQMAGDLATKHSDDTKAGQKAYEEVRKHRDTEKGSTVYENRLRMAERKMRSRMSMMNMFNIVDPVTNKVVAQDILFMKALESKSDTSAIIAEKQRLRDITKKVDGCKTTKQLNSIIL